MNFEKPIIFRILLSVVLACIAVTLFVLNRNTIEKPAAQTKEDFALTLSRVDRDVDTMLVRFGIERSWITKRQITSPNSPDIRIERKITIPPTLPSVQMNVALNLMAKRYNGRAVATENLKENSVTIHIELEKRIVQTIILIVKTDLKRTKQPQEQTKV
jgi:hypothetical protein